MSASQNTMSYEELLERAQARSALNHRVKVLLAESLGLEIAPELIGSDQPLFGRGLELDSLDTLEIVVLLEEQFGVTISDDDRAAFGSINRLVDFTVAELGEIPGLNEDGEDGEDGANAANAEAKADDVRMGVAA